MVVKLYTLICDSCGSVQQDGPMGVDQSAILARAYSREIGWVKVANPDKSDKWHKFMDYCPECKIK